ncbi:hypothetical protein RJ640_017051 [Escallonia rubra]|uniref:DUF4218 domain-containing protein n=1 Tax=Escallonia rubra TaxID=112253 RepID=A0AA88UDB1_9ASTE|nr:hypothetical protein RJ640_017051 [Escallonia rubra]
MVNRRKTYPGHSMQLLVNSSWDVLRGHYHNRYLFTLEAYVRNRSRPEGSIAEGYWLEECVTFYSRYSNEDVETKLYQPVRIDDGGDSSINSLGGRPLGASEGFVLDDISYAQAHQYVQMLYEEGDEALSEEAISLAMGPLKKAERYTGYVINEFKYHTKARESNRATQHSGVMVKANTDSYASARDMNPIAGDSPEVDDSNCFCCSPRSFDNVGSKFKLFQQDPSHTGSMATK